MMYNTEYLIRQFLLISGTLAALATPTYMYRNWDSPTKWVLLIAVLLHALAYIQFRRVPIVASKLLLYVYYFILSLVVAHNNDSIVHGMFIFTLAITLATLTEKPFAARLIIGLLFLLYVSASLIFTPSATVIVAMLFVPPLALMQEILLSFLDKMQEQTNKLHQADLATQKFIAKMSHELRTPLNGVLGANQMLLHTKELTAEQQSYVEASNHSALLLLSIVEDVLSVSKLKSEEFRLDKSVIGVSDIIETVQENLATVLSNKPVDVYTQIDKRLQHANIIVDKKRLLQLLFNITGYAAKSTKVGYIKISVEPVQDFVQFRVEDTGDGIAEEHMDKIFVPFTYIVDNENIEEQSPGVGIGLSICKNLTEAMDGRIEVISAEHVGTTITVNIPAEITSSSPEPIIHTTYPTKITEDTDISRSSKLVVVIDDDKVNTTVLSQITSKVTDNTVAFCDPTDALNFILKNKQDIALIMCDYHMPKLNGIQLIEQVRAKGYTKPIVMVTGYAYASDKIEALKAGATDYITKPVNFNDTLAILREYLK